MKVSYCSDLHLEFMSTEPHNFSNRENSDILILSGDICLVKEIQNHSDFFDLITSKYKQVLYVLGNHEFYKGKLYKTIKLVKEFASQYNNLIILNNESVLIEGVLFVGSTLWSDFNKFNPVSMMACIEAISDFDVIRDDSTEHYLKVRPYKLATLHKEAIEFIKTTVSGYIGDVVVITHHCPSSLSCDPDYIDDFHTNGAYFSSDENVILYNENIKFWVCGHTHKKHEYQLGECIVKCNPRGYPSGTVAYATFKPETFIV